MNIFNIQVLGLGAIVPRLAIGGDGCIAEFMNRCLNIFVLINRPSPNMLKEASSTAHGLNLALYTYHNVMTFAVKPGNLAWHDAPYNPHATYPLDLPKNEQLNEGLGILVNYFLVDSSIGKILEMRNFALSNKFSNAIIKDIYSIRKNEPNMFRFAVDVDSIQRRYSPTQIGTKLKQHCFNLSPTEKT